jgi:transcriptional regulator with XRE-family HTH domain
VAVPARAGTKVWGCLVMSDEQPDGGSEAIGELLVRLRKVHGYSQDMVAQLLCMRSGTTTVTRNEVSRWERQLRTPSQYWLRYLAEVLHTPVEALRAAVAVTRGDSPPLPSAVPAVGGDAAVVLVTVQDGLVHFMIRGNYQGVLSLNHLRRLEHCGSCCQDEDVIGL